MEMQYVWLGIIVLISIGLLVYEKKRFDKRYAKPPPIEFPVSAEFWTDSRGSMVLAHESDNDHEWIEAGYRLVKMEEVS